jgi:erythronate-4-phosphate dehydrogenase
VIRLVVDDNIVGLEQLPTEALEVIALPGRALCAADLCGADALWVRSVSTVNAELLGDSKLRFVGTATAGIDHVDTQLLAERGVAFVAAPGANANAVAEYVLAALLTLAEPWERLEAGDTLGIVGYGAVGRRLSAIGEALGWTVRVCDPWVASQDPDATGILEAGAKMPDFCTLDELLDCTVISLHCSLHRQAPWPSHHLLGDNALRRLKDRQWLINAARGAVVDNAALLTHLSRPQPVNCVLDVWEGEPAFNVALLDQPALALATPHIAGYSWDAKWQATRMLYAAMQRQGLLSKPLDSNDLAPPALRPASGVGTDALRGLMEQRYRIGDDDARFRSLQTLGGAERVAGFDKLRRNYPQRRELLGSTLHATDSLPAELQRFLRALGVNIAV